MAYHSSSILSIDVLNDRITGVYTTETDEEVTQLESITVEAATQQLLRLLHTLYVLSELYDVNDVYY